MKRWRCDSEALKELLELPDELCVHSLHQGPKALVANQGLLCLQLFIDKLLERNAVHRVLKSQLQRDKENRKRQNLQLCVKDKLLTTNYLLMFDKSTLRLIKYRGAVLLHRL